MGLVEGMRILVKKVSLEGRGNTDTVAVYERVGGKCKGYELSRLMGPVGKDRAGLMKC